MISLTCFIACDALFIGYTKACYCYRMRFNKNLASCANFVTCFIIVVGACRIRRFVMEQPTVIPDRTK